MSFFMNEELVQTSAAAETIIFWDISGCKPPHGLNVLKVVTNISDALDDEGCGNLTFNSIRLYCDVFEMAEVLCHTNIGMLHYTDVSSVKTLSYITATEEDRRKKIFVDFMCMAVGHLDSLNLLLIMEDISGRQEFLHAFRFFQRRKNVNLSQPHLGEVSDMLLSSVEAVWVWESLSISGYPIGEEEEKAQSEWRTKTITKPEFNSAMLQRSDLRKEEDNNIKRKAKTADSTKAKIETSNRFSALETLSDD